MDKSVQTGSGGMKNAFTQCTTGAKVEMSTQVEVQKKGEKGCQTIGLAGGPVGLQSKVCRLEVLKGDAQIVQQKKKKKKKKQRPPADPSIPIDPNAIPEDEESYYEYYEEEVDEEDQPPSQLGSTPAQSNLSSQQPPPQTTGLAGIGGYPVYVNNPKKT